MCAQTAEIEMPSIGAEFRSITEQVYTALLEAITERRFPPGQRLVLDDLAAHLGVSRTPIRAALTRLAAEGLVQAAGRTGVRVTQVSPEELMDLYDVRLMCESFAIERGIENVTPELLRELDEVIITPGRAGLAGPKQRLAQVLRDKLFHERIVGLAKNRALAETYQRLNIHVHGLRVGPLPVPPGEAVAADNSEHAAIIAALRRKDVAAAQEALKAHISSTAKRAISSMALAR